MGCCRMSKPGKNRRRGGDQATSDKWQRWQLFATVVRIVVDLVDRFTGAGPGASFRGDAQGLMRLSHSLLPRPGCEGRFLYASNW